MEDALLKLLTTLEALGEIHEELYDSEVRERMRNAIMDGFVREKPNFEVPRDLGMFTDEANGAVQRALEIYISAANKRSRELGIVTFHVRLAAFQNGNVRTHSETGIYYDDLFGYAPPEWYDSDGNVLWDRAR
jgi:hypothetical protein